MYKLYSIIINTLSPDEHMQQFECITKRVSKRIKYVFEEERSLQIKYCCHESNFLHNCVRIFVKIHTISDSK